MNKLNKRLGGEKLEYLYILEGFFTLEPIEVIIKLVVIYILAGIIGLERASLSKPAGFRTHVLVGISAVLTVICGEKISEISGDSDFSRIPAQLLSGLGFLGAGTILRDGFNVKGLTTAASLLCTTCIGIIVGSGFYLGGIIGTLILYIILTHVYRLGEGSEGKYKDYEFLLKYKETCDIEKVQEIFEMENYSIESLKKDSSDKSFSIKGKYTIESNKTKLIANLMNDTSIIEIIEG